MKTKAKIILSAIALFLAIKSPCQDTLDYSNFYPEGISFKYGIGAYSIKDEYISNEKYSGYLPYLSIGWARKHNKYTYLLEMAYRNSNSITNYNVSTKITQGILNQGFLYPLKSKELFQNDLYLWLGPSTEFFIFFNDQNVAVSGFDYAQSVAILASLGLNVDAIYPVNLNFQLESSLKLSLMSFGFRLVDTDEGDEPMEKFLTLFSGMNSSLDLGARYHLINHLSLKIAYRFELTRVSAWDPLLAASDNLILSLTYRF